MIDLPYFDILLEKLQNGPPEFRDAFGRHVHWGYWPRPRGARGTFDDFSAAAERLCVRVCDSADIRKGDRVLDVGCGLGGTLASINENYQPVELTGLNIDQRQLDYAAANVKARPGNTLELVQGDACEMPFEDNSFDVVTALECAFHFESRVKFLSEVARVLRPGGRFALCDLLPASYATPLLFAKQAFFDGYVKKLVGPSDISWTRDRYVGCAERNGLRLAHEEDITANTIPTYKVLRSIARVSGQHVMTAAWGTLGMEYLGRLGLLRYVILSFDTPAAGRTAARDKTDGKKAEPKVAEPIAASPSAVVSERASAE